MKCPHCGGPTNSVRVRYERFKPVPDPAGETIRFTCPTCRKFIGSHPADESKRTKAPKRLLEPVVVEPEEIADE